LDFIEFSGGYYSFPDIPSTDRAMARILIVFPSRSMIPQSHTDRASAEGKEGRKRLGLKPVGARDSFWQKSKPLRRMEWEKD